MSDTKEYPPREPKSPVIRVLIQFRAGENQAPIEAYIKRNWRVTTDGHFLPVWWQEHDAENNHQDLWINKSTIASVKPL